VARKIPGVPAARALTSARGLLPALLAGAAVTAAAAALAGCGQVDAALSKQWAVVNFRPDTTVATLIKVRDACSHVPNVRPVTASSVTGDLDATYSVRYVTSKASGANLAALQTCLEKFSAVSGVSIQDISDQG
jgi:hypothetical protein